MKKDDRLFEIFTSEFVIVMINKDAEDVVQTEESITSSKHPIQFAGFLTDMDDDYIYLGGEPGTISQAVRRDLLMHVHLANPDDMEEIDNIPAPTNKGLN